MLIIFKTQWNGHITWNASYKTCRRNRKHE